MFYTLVCTGVNPPFVNNPVVTHPVLEFFYAPSLNFTASQPFSNYLNIYITSICIKPVFDLIMKALINKWWF